MTDMLASSKDGKCVVSTKQFYLKLMISVS